VLEMVISDEQQFVFFRHTQTESEISGDMKESVKVEFLPDIFLNLLRRSIEVLIWGRPHIRFFLDTTFLLRLV